MKNGKKEKVFISGRVSGLNYRYACDLFRDAEKILKSNGYEVVNPTKICKVKWCWWHSMLVCLYSMLKCDIVYFLKKHEESKGSRIELKVARLFRKSIVFE